MKKDEQMLKMVLKPVAGTAQEFALAYTKVLCENGISKKWKREVDFRATKIKFKKLVERVPATPGIIIVSGKTKNRVTTLKLIRSMVSLKEELFTMQNDERIVNLIQLIHFNKFESLQFQYAKCA